MSALAPDFAALLAEAVEAQRIADASWIEVKAAMERHRPFGAAAVGSWRDACGASGMPPLEFGSFFLNACEEAGAARDAAGEGE